MCIDFVSWEGKQVMNLYECTTSNARLSSEHFPFFLIIKRYFGVQTTSMDLHWLEFAQGCFADLNEKSSFKEPQMDFKKRQKTKQKNKNGIKRNQTNM